MSDREKHRDPHRVAVAAREQLTRHFVRVTLSGTDLRTMRARPAQDIQLLLDDCGRGAKRRYTIRHLRSDVGELDIDVLLHDSAGPGSSWAAQAEIGDTVEFLGPRGKLEPQRADWHLLVGDDAALPAIAALTEALGERTTTIVLGEVGGPEDEIPIPATRLHMLHRAGTPAGTPRLLATAMGELRAPPGVGCAYLLGESRVVHGLREYLEHAGIPRERTFVKGYWNRDRGDHQ